VEKKIEVANKCLIYYLATLVIKETKTSMAYHYSLHRGAKH
jgi:hypothetical protein